MLCRLVAFSNAIASRGSHPFNQVWTVKQKTDGVSQLFAITVGVKKASYAMTNQFESRAQIRRNHWAPPRIRLENRFSQGLVSMRRKNGKAAASYELLQFLAVDHAREKDVGKVQFAGERF